MTVYTKRYIIAITLLVLSLVFILSIGYMIAPTPVQAGSPAYCGKGTQVYTSGPLAGTWAVYFYSTGSGANIQHRVRHFHNNNSWHDYWVSCPYDTWPTGADN